MSGRQHRWFLFNGQPPGCATCQRASGHCRAAGGQHWLNPELRAPRPASVHRGSIRPVPDSCLRRRVTSTVWRGNESSGCPAWLADPTTATADRLWSGPVVQGDARDAFARVDGLDLDRHDQFVVARDRVGGDLNFGHPAFEEKLDGLAGDGAVGLRAGKGDADDVAVAVEDGTAELPGRMSPTT